MESTVTATLSGGMGKRAALAPDPAGRVQALNLKQESDALYSGYLREAARLALAGFGAIVVLLLGQLAVLWPALKAASVPPALATRAA